MSLAGLTSPLANHLWQSTALVAAAWLLAFALRKNQARLRYWIWLIASLKFLVPFSLLIAVGRYIGSKIVAPIAHPSLSSVMEQITQPFPQAESIVAPALTAAQHNVHLLAIFLFSLWAIGFLAIAFSWTRRWIQIRSAVRAASPLPLAADVPVLSTPSLLEPGVFGIFRPVLLLPQGIQVRLTPAQMQAVIAHEMCHVRRRDNFTFALHMLVETLFWFHPVVWWIGSRLIEERECACDEAVLQAGSDSEVYAEGILNVCKFYVESPLACVSGVSGSDLKKRIVRIMTEHVMPRLDFRRKLLLAVAGLLAIAVPVASGFARATQSRAESQTQDATTQLPAFEVASVKPNKGGDGGTKTMFTPDGVSYTGISLQMLLRETFGMEDDRILGAPNWAKTDRYDVEAKVESSDAPKLKDLTFAQRRQMLLPILADRFNLKFHHESKELPTYALVIAKSGLKLKEAKPGDTYPNRLKGPNGPGGAGTLWAARGKITGQGVPIANLLNMLSYQRLDRTIFDETGLTGKYDFVLEWTPDDAPPPMSGSAQSGPPRNDTLPDAAGPSLFTALQEQLGLKLEPQKGPVDVIVIDHVERPSEN